MPTNLIPLRSLAMRRAASRLKSARTALGWSQEQAAEHLREVASSRYGAPTVSRWENARSEVPAWVLEELERVLAERKAAA